MNFEKYANTVPYPNKKDFTTYYHYKGGKLLGKTGSKYPLAEGAVVETVVDEDSYEVARQAYYNEQSKANEMFFDDLAEELGITSHPKKGKFFSLCWYEGHSGGLSEVYNVACTWVELLED